MTAGQFVDLMQTLRALAKAGALAMEVFKVQVDLVVKIRPKIVARVRRPRTHRKNSGAHFIRKMIDVFRIPRWVFDVLSARARTNQNDSTGCHSQNAHRGLH